MGTKAYTDWSSGYTPSGSSTARKFRGAIEYSSRNNTATSITYDINYGVQMNYPANCTFNITGSATGGSDATHPLSCSYTYDISEDWFGGHDWDFVRTYTKGHTAVTKTFKVTAKGSTGTPTAWQNTTLTKTVTITVPAKTSYTVSFNVNGGSGTIASQTKWYDETLTLTTAKPTREGYAFKGWNTSADGTGTNYSSGGSYTANAGTTLYAIWHQLPSLTATVTSTAPYYYPIDSYSVSISNITTYDSATVSSIILTVGSQSVSRTDAGTLTITPNASGTFTPTVVITDSQSGSQTYTLPAITINTYTEPSVVYSLDRTTSTGVHDDEGNYVVVESTFTFTDAIATLQAPTVAVTDENGTAKTVTMAWYSTRASDGTLSGSVTWSSLSSGDTVYGLISITGEFDTGSYLISVTPQDSEGTGTAITQTLPSAFFTMDFLAGGRGIAIGQPSTQVGFIINMDTTFNQDIRMELDDSAGSGTDYEILTALTTFGWSVDPT